MLHETVHYTKLTTDESESGGANEESDGDDEVTVYLKQSGDGRQRATPKKNTWFRVMVAVILLGIVVRFMLLESQGWWSDPKGLEGAGSSNEHNEMAENTKDTEGDHHHHHNGGEDDDDDDDEHDDHDHLDHDHGHASLYHHAVVITSSANCSRIGRELLREGGNLVDACVASLLCLGVVHPHTAGIGGTFSAVFYNHTSRSLKRIRSSASRIPETSYGVPSMLQGLKLLHSKWGQTDWSRLFHGAVKLSRDGFLVDEILGRALKSHEGVVVESGLCALFCDDAGRVKSPGASSSNRNLSELLRGVSLNESHFPETLAVKLAEDLSPSERPGFLEAVRRSGGGEISNDSLISEGEKYNVVSAGSGFASPLLSGILERAKEQSRGFWSGADLKGVAMAYAGLLNLTQELEENVTQSFASNLQSSLVGVLDEKGNFILLSTSMDGTWGSGRFLPSSGVVLGGFTDNVLVDSNFPLVLKINDDDGEDEEVEVLAVTGGISAVVNAAVLLHHIVDVGMTPPEALRSPLFHLEPDKTLCLSFVSNGSDVYRLFAERDGQLRETVQCLDGCQAVLLRLHAEHIGAYGAPLAGVHVDGY